MQYSSLTHFRQNSARWVDDSWIRRIYMIENWLKHEFTRQGGYSFLRGVLQQWKKNITFEAKWIQTWNKECSSYCENRNSIFRHVILSAGNNFTDTMWQIVTDGLESTLEVTTYSLRQIMTLFKANSENFYGDIGQVKVATRKDCSPAEFIRMWHLAQQVCCTIMVLRVLNGQV